MYKVIRAIAICLFISAWIAVNASGRDSYADSLLRQAYHPERSVKERAACFIRYARYMERQAPDTTIVYARKGIGLALTEKQYREVTVGYIAIGDAYNVLGKFDELFYIADTVVYYAGKAAFKEGLYSASILRGESLRRKASFDDALKHYINAATIADSIADKWYLATALGYIRMLYTTIQDIPRAMEYQHRALDLWLQTDYTENIAACYGGLGILYRERKMYDSALHYYRKSAQYAFNTEDSSWIAFCCNDIGAAHSFLGNFDSSEYYLKMSVGIRERMNELHELPYTYNYLGENYERKRNLEQAEHYIRKALDLAIALGNHKQTYEAYESLSDFFSRNKRYDSAYHYAMLHKIYKDSFVKVQQNEIIADLTTRYETVKKERIIREQQAVISRRNIGIAGVSTLLMVALFTGYAFYRKKKSEQQLFLQKELTRQQELAGKAVIEAEEKERHRIAGDLHDSVGQMISAAKLNLSALRQELLFKTKDSALAFDKALALVDESCREVRTVSHNIMPNALLKSGLADAIRSFIGKIDQRIIHVNFYAEGFNEKMDQSVESILYRVIQECVNNVIRHSGANKLDIALVRDEEGISATIEDNGCGFDVSSRELAGGIGMKNIRSRVGYLKGTVEWDAVPGKGTVVAIFIPET